MDANRFYGKRKQPELSVERGSAARSLEDGNSGNSRPRGAIISLHSKIPLLEPERLWRVFPRQQMAYDFARTCCQNTAVFAYESEEFGHSGQRKYLVTTYYEFGQQYLAMKQPKHFYEVIPEGSACHLYFDIEFKLEYNKSVIPLVLLETFIEYVCYHLQEQFRLSCDRHNIIDLDSSTETKFSRHLIFHIPSTVFRNNIHAGHFVHFICDELRELKKTGLSNKTPPSKPVQSRHIQPSVCKLLALFVKNGNGAEVLICDEGVYTKNRNFRLLYSSKLGKKVPLVVSKENTFLTSYSEDVSRPGRSRLYNILMDSLVCNVRFERSCKVLEFMPRHCTSKSAMCSTYRSSGAKVEGTEEGYYCSPYPSVDQFITSRVARGGVQGSIRRWTFFPQGKLLAYDIQHNRWCESIGRAHKSNNIMMIADLSRGIYYQKCHDPDCKRINFRSQEYEIPRECNPVQVSSTSSTEPESCDIARAESSEGIEWVERLSEQDMRDFLEDNGFPNQTNSEDVTKAEMNNTRILGSGGVIGSDSIPGLDGSSHEHETCVDTTEPQEQRETPQWRQMGQENIKKENAVASASKEQVESIRLDHEMDDIDEHLFIEALDNYESSNVS